MDAYQTQIGYNARVDEFRDEEYPMLKGEVYLDHAGTTPPSKSLTEAFARDMTSNLFGNPHSASASSQLSTSRIEDIRLRLLQFFNASPDEFDLVFVANATAGIKLVADALRAGPDGFDYAYHQASHTSLVGVREEARNSVCLIREQVIEWCRGTSPFEGRDESSRPVLFAFPAQSNMDGTLYPASWSSISRRRSSIPSLRNTYTLMDAAALASSSPLEFCRVDSTADFTVVSLHKIFGFPDLGALIVRRGAEEVFNSRRYFGGGTVDMVVCLKEQWHAPKSQFLHERLEHGTVPIHNILALDAAMDAHARLFGSMRDVSTHTAFLLRKLYRGLKSLRHGNGKSVCTIYSLDPNEPRNKYCCGPIIAFNIRNSQDAWISLAEVEKLAALRHFHIRTGGVCNPGGIASALRLEPWEMKQNFSSGFRCGTDNDIMAGKPTGVIRVSLGAMSTISDVDSFVGFIAEFYQDLPLPSPVAGPKQPADKAELCVQGIHIYPIKSCGRFEVSPELDWEVRPEGLAWDREWCLVHQGTGQALSQKRYPKMALIRPTLDLFSGLLRVKYAGHLPVPFSTRREISIPISNNPVFFRPASPSQQRASRVCGEEVQTQIYSSKEINDFFSTVLGVPCLLARFPPDGQGKGVRHNKAHLQNHQVCTAPAQPAGIPGSFPERPPSPPESDSEKAVVRRILLSNESPILAITLPSLDALNEEIGRTGSREVISPAVFRANIVIGPAPGSQKSIQPYEEDTWTKLSIGTDRQFEMLGSCRRCHMVCINQETAEKSEEPFVTLSKTRRFDGKVFFGVHMCYSGDTSSRLTREKQFPTIRLGDLVVPDRMERVLINSS